jgi:Putative auto-transporter adhesin, head GIN domain
VIRLVPLAAVALVLAGCGGGPRVTETRVVEPFERIEVSDSVEVEVVPGSGTELRVRAGRDVMDRVRTESSGGVLRLGVIDRGIVIGPDPLGDVRVEVAADTVRGLLIDGSGDVTLVDLDEDELELEVEGAGEIEASGTVDRLTATIQGAGDANLSELATRTARVTVQGAGDADLNVSEELDVTVQGAGDVSYRGDPQVHSDIQGVGDISREPR